MNTRYYIADGTNVALRITHSDKVSIEKWNGEKWEKADTKYLGVFSDDIPITPIEIGDNLWIKLGLREN